MPVRIFDTMARDEGRARPRGSRASCRCTSAARPSTTCPHVGHGRTAVVFDVIRRYLEWTGLDVTFVSNVTDVEDKIIAPGRRDGHDRARARRRASRRPTSTRWTGSACAARPTCRTRPSTSSRCSSSSASSSTRATPTSSTATGRCLLRRRRRSRATARCSHRTLEQLLESRRRARRGRRGEAQPGRLRALEGREARRAGVGLAVGPGPARAGTSSARRCRSSSSARASTSTAAATTSCSRTTRTSGRRPRRAGHAFARHWIHSGDGAGRRREDVEVARQLHDARRRARRARSPRVPPGRAADALPAARWSSTDAELAAAAEAVDRLDALFRRAAAAGIDPSGAPLDEPTVERFRAAMDDDFGTPGRGGGDLRRGRRRQRRDRRRRRTACRVAGRDRRRARRGARARASVPRRRSRTTRSTRWSRRATRPAPPRTSPRPTGSATSSRARGVTLEDTAERHDLAPLVNPRGGAKPARSRPPRESLGAEQVEGRRAVRELLGAGRRRVRSCDHRRDARAQSRARRAREPRGCARRARARTSTPND